MLDPYRWKGPLSPDYDEPPIPTMHPKPVARLRRVTKHGDHDQSSHGNWASGGSSESSSGRVPVSREAIKTAYEVGWGSVAEGRGVNVAQLREWAVEAIETRLKDAEVRIRVASEDLWAILEDGRLKTQYETNDSGGNLDPAYRMKEEARMFGLKPDTSVSEIWTPHDATPPAYATTDVPIEERPIYGFLSDRNLADDVGEDFLGQYGDLTIRLKDDTLDRTTFNTGDSLGTRTQAPTPFRAPEAASISPYELPDLLDGTETDFTSLAKGSGYVEAQVHGGVTLDDIAEVLIPEAVYEEERTTVGGQKMESGLKAILDQAGVPFRIIPTRPPEPREPRTTLDIPKRPTYVFPSDR